MKNLLNFQKESAKIFLLIISTSIACFFIFHSRMQLNAQNSFLSFYVFTLNSPTETQKWESVLRSAAKVNSIYREGPKRQGFYSTDKKIQKMRLDWRSERLFANIHTASKSTPAVDESGIYFGTDLGVFHALSHEGLKLWSFNASAGQQGIHGSALLDENFVYFGTYEGNFYCLEKTTGKLIWTTKLADAVGSSPMILGNRIVTSAEFNSPRQGYLVAMDKATGKLIWRTEYFGEQVHSSPTWIEGTDLIGVGSNANLYFGFDLNSGQLKWKYSVGGPIKGTAAVYRDLFCYATWDQNVYCNNLIGINTKKFTLAAKSQSSLAIDEKNGFGYLTDGKNFIYKLNLEKGGIEKSVLLDESPSHFTKMGTLSKPSPILLQSAGRLSLFSSCYGDSICELDPDNLKIRQRLNIGGYISGSVEYFQNRLYVLLDDQGLAVISLD